MDWAVSAGLVVSGAALLVSFVALMLSREAFYRDHVPLVRVVRTQRPQAIVLKNIGRGPAMAVVLVDGQESALASVDVVEPIGPGPKESERLGRVVLQLDKDLSEGRIYRLFYQDLRGYWHVTDFCTGPDRLRTTFGGRQWSWNVPSSVKQFRQLKTVLEEEL